ncbi:FG-GAP-like repeat-containing protein [Leifsonia sp. NPDC058248]|uniref:FG-GAP-like repeat-containing protein n=1 Tax=Leifsonia sp. NPDC058248 TaxID=3346402 RepID=UPI0036DE5C71
MSILNRSLTAMTVTIALLATGTLAAVAETPAPTPTPSAAAPSAPVATDGQPTLQQMNAARNHTMGSTIAGADPGLSSASGSRLLAQAAGQPSGVQGLDVSGWQVLGMADWTRVWANGGRFAYVKATESTDFTSSQFSEQYTDSYRAGLVRGAYHFATPNTSSGAAQANFFVDHGGHWINDGRTLPPLLDIEYNPYGATCYGLSAAQMVSWIRDFSNTVRARVGRLPAIYSTTDWWTRCTGNNGGFGANPLVIARYPNDIASGAGTLPAGWSRYTMWQWNNHGVYPGDQDVFNGNVAQLLALTRSGSTAIALDSPIVGVGDLNGDGKRDLIARRGDGSLWCYAGNGKAGTQNAGMASGVRIGLGWNAFDALIGVGDYNHDGKPDLLGRQPDGSLWFYPGTGVINSTSSGFGAGVKIDTGWNAYAQLTAPGDLDGDGRPDLLARKPDGTLWFFGGTGTVEASNTGHKPGVQIGSGWQVFTQVLGIGDQNKDGIPDLAGFRNDGTVWVYAGTGGASGSWFKAGQRMTIAGLSDSDTLTAPGDVSGDGLPDLYARAFDGTLKFIPGYPLGNSGLQAAVSAGTGWTTDTVALDIGDANKDGKPDVVTRRTDGTLWLRPGTRVGAALYGTPTRIGIGWNSFAALAAPGDLNGDGAPDVLGLTADGSIWFYPGATSSGGAFSLRAGVKVGVGWPKGGRLLAGDFNGDGRADLLSVGTDGRVWFSTGRAPVAGKPVLGSAVLIGVGWNIFNAIVSPSDLDGDKRPDLVARRPDGTLWFYHGIGALSSGGVGFKAALRIGTGWGIFRSLLGAHDTNADGRMDVLGVRPDGSAWYYAGNGLTGDLLFAYSSALRVGTGWSVFQ